MKKQILASSLLLVAMFITGCSSSEDSAMTAEELNNSILNETKGQNPNNASVKPATGTKYLNYSGDMRGYDAGIENIREAKFLTFVDKHSSNIYLIDKLNYDKWSVDGKMPTELKTNPQFYKGEIKEVSESYKGINEEKTYYEITNLGSMTETTDVPEYNQ